ncbi:MAG: DUF4465 domain-containing protein [Bacteroidales bacterium]|nr:DUF4465 domain-containing protein [Bacteroidales bacterium]
MKRFLKTIAVVVLCAFSVTSCYDDSALQTAIADLQKQMKDVNEVIEGIKGGSVIKTVTKTDDGYTFTMSDGTSLGVKNGSDGAPASVIETSLWSSTAVFDLGKVQTFPIDVKGVNIVDAFPPAGWAASVENNLLTVTAPRNPDLARRGSVIVVATNGNSLVVMTVSVALNILDVNGSYWNALIDTPQYGGPLLYGEMDPETWSYNATYIWADPVTGLEFRGFPSYWGSVCFSSGGEVISNYVVPNPYGADYLRQLEVPIAPPTGNNFIVHFGDDNPDSPKSYLCFQDGKARRITSLKFIPTNYLINSCLYGDGFFGPLGTDSKIEVDIIGYGENDGEYFSTKTLIDGKDVAAYRSGQKKFEWQTADLSFMGPIVKIGFEISGTSDCYGEYGFNAPAYFAYCDVVVEEDYYVEP